MSKSMNAPKSKESPTPMAQTVCEELDEDHFTDLNSSEAPANNIESDSDTEVVEPEPVTKKKKTKNMKGKDKAPVINLRDEIRANRQKIPNLGGRFKVGSQIA